MKEIWKDIEGYEGKYQVSNLGRIKSLMKTKNSLRTINLMVLLQCPLLEGHFHNFLLVKR